MVTAAFGLLQCLLHDIFGDTGNFDIHLQRGDTFRCTGHFKVHIAEMIFITQNVGENRKAVIIFDEAHSDTGDRALNRNAGIHHGQ